MIKSRFSIYKVKIVCTLRNKTFSNDNGLRHRTKYPCGFTCLTFFVLIGLALPTFSTIVSNGTKWNQKLVQYVIDAVESIHRGNAGHEFRSQAFAAQ